jgi:hypothetical protein
MQEKGDREQREGEGEQKSERMNKRTEEREERGRERETSEANLSTIAKPMPAVEPVTKATLRRKRENKNERLERKPREED